MNGNEEAFLRYLHNRGSVLKRPVSGTFEITSRCNLDCKMCYVHSDNCARIRNAELTSAEWMRIADELKKSGVLMMLITGGEPLLREDFKDIYLYLKKIGMAVQINTNGTLINDEILSLFRQYPPMRVAMSVYGASDETYYALCGKKGMYQKVIDNALAMKEAGIRLKISITANQFNSGDILKIYEWAKSNGFPVQATSYMFPSVRLDCSNLRPSPEDAAKNTFKCFQGEYGDRLNSVLQELTDGKNPTAETDDITDDLGERIWCRAGKSTFWITWRGELSPCGMMPEPKISLLENSFEDSWKYISEKAAEIRLPARCANCELRHMCDVCAASCYAENKKFGALPLYQCKKTEAFNKIVKEVLENAQNQ